MNCGDCRYSHNTGVELVCWGQRFSPPVDRDHWCENWKPIVNSKPIEEKKMKYDSFDELCPHCGRILRGYKGLKECFCKFCGGKILR